MVYSTKNKDVPARLTTNIERIINMACVKLTYEQKRIFRAEYTTGSLRSIRVTVPCFLFGSDDQSFL